MDIRALDPTSCPTCCTPLGGRRVDAYLTRTLQEEERARLRPLLERALDFMETELPDVTVRRNPAILADLRRELGKETKP